MHMHMESFADVIEAAYVCVCVRVRACDGTHVERARSFKRWNRTCSDCAAFMDAMQEQRHYNL